MSLYVAGTGGNGTAATNLSSGTAVITNSAGQFTVNGNFTCPSASTSQAYLVATGGNLANASNNSQLVLVTALGSCSTALALSGVVINDVTTAAAAWALSGFMTSASNVAASSTNSLGIANAFANAALIANPATGAAGGAAQPTGAVLETAKVNTLANFLAACSASSGGVACSSIFSTTGACTAGCSSLDTLQAALWVVKHPGQNVSAVYQIASSATTLPYSGALTAVPHDWTLSMAYVGGGIYEPSELAVDTEGDVWVADYLALAGSNGAVSAFSPQGTPLSGTTGFASTVLGPELLGLAIDGNSNVWVTVEEAPSGQGAVQGVSGISSGQVLGQVINLAGMNYASGFAISFPESMATSQNGSIIVGNEAGSSASVFNYSAANGLTFSSTVLGYQYSSHPTDVSGDLGTGVWLPDYGASTTLTHVDASGKLISHAGCCSLPNGVATDKYGFAWVSNFNNDSVSMVAPGCDSNASPGTTCLTKGNVVVIGDTADCGTIGAPAGACGANGGGIFGPSKIAVDAAQNVWVLNYRGSSISELAGNSNPCVGVASSTPMTVTYSGVPYYCTTISTGAAATVAPGTAISPANSYDAQGNMTGQGGFGLDANMSAPYDLAPDASGNLWVSDNRNRLVVFFGLAAPTATPRMPLPAAP